MCGGERLIIRILSKGFPPDPLHRQGLNQFMQLFTLQRFPICFLSLIMMVHTGFRLRLPNIRLRWKYIEKRRTRRVGQGLMETRRKTRTIYVGKVPVGGGHLVVVQSMTKTNTLDIEATVKQIQSLESIGCEIIRLAVPNMKAAKVLGTIKKSGHPKPEALVESAERSITMLEGMDFTNIKISLKGSDVLTTVDAYRLFSDKYDYPLHIGVSESGPPSTGIIKSSVGCGILLSEGIGDTIRVSLTAEPEEEVRVAYEILKSLGLRKRGAEIISCPTCGR